MAWAAEGRQRADWNRTAALLAITANVNRDPKRRPTPFTAEEFNPYSNTGTGMQTSGDIVRLDAEQSVRAVAGVFGGKPRRKGAR